MGTALFGHDKNTEIRGRRPGEIRFQAALVTGREPMQGEGMDRPHEIRIRLDAIHRLFNTMDSAPFLERDLDGDAEEFIVSWAEEAPGDRRIVIRIELNRRPTGLTPDEIGAAVRHYFSSRREMNRREFSRLMREGRATLLIGLCFLALCLTLARHLGAISGTLGNDWAGIAAEGLTIAGWVAMWHPVEIGLYRWWPIRRTGVILKKLSEAEVTVTWAEDDGESFASPRR